MAQKFGGTHSPGASKQSQTDWSSRKPAKSRARTGVITAFAGIMFFIGVSKLISGDAMSTLLVWASAAGLGLASWLFIEGERAQDAFEARQIAKPPAIPRKLFGSVLLGLSIFTVFFQNADWSLINAILFGAMGSGLGFATFGADPMRSKGLEGDNAFDRERVAVAIEKAEGYVTDTLASIKRIGDRGLTARVEELASAARDMFRTIENDPRDLSSSRKYLTVYLKGARDATLKFVDLYARTGDAKARTDYEALLQELETSFAQRREVLLLENRTDLDVEIEVLRDRLSAAQVKS